MRTPNLNPMRARPIGLLISFVGLLAIAYSVTLRIEPGVLFNSLLSEMHTSPQALNDLNAHYQYSLIAALVVAGIVVDILGPRLTLSLALIVAICGNYLFASADSLTTVSYSRILIGYAHPFILISVLTLGTLWLPRRHFAFFVGLVFATLLMFPNVISPYLSTISTKLQLHMVTLQLNSVGTAIILFIIFTLRAGKTQMLDKTNFKSILAPLTQHQIWLIAFVSLLGWIPNTFLLNYGATYLHDNFHMLPKIANDTVKIAFSCFALGAVTTGLFAGWLEKNRFIITAGYLLAALIFVGIIFTSNLSNIMVSTLIFVAAILASVAVICYAYAYDYCSPGRTGITFGLVACITTIGNTLMARQIGNLMDKYINHIPNNIPWHWIVILVPLSLLIGAIIATSLRKPPYLSE
jgi:predicted MFS family arabinose efflux permease